MIKAFFRRLFKRDKKVGWRDLPGDDFSNFINYATEEEQRELFTRVVKKANEDQNKIIQKYDEITSKSA